MSDHDIEAERIRALNDAEPGGGEYVLHWMQQSQRAEHNPALEYAVQQANELDQRLLVCFGLMDDYPEANARHYAFMLEGLADVEAGLRQRGIKFVIQRGSPEKVAARLGRDASLVVCDRGYLRHQKAWRRAVARRMKCRVVEVEGDVVVPVNEVSDKAEYAARTIRPKIHRRLEAFLRRLEPTQPRKASLNLSVESLDVSGPRKRQAVLESLRLDGSIAPVGELFAGGTAAARERFASFLEQRFKRYAEHRNQPQTSDVSHMSKYLHFGQISPVELALAVRGTRYGTRKDKDAFIEELVVRRELACNFVEFTTDYDQYRCLPRWARATLRRHRDDDRPHLYTRQQLEDAETHDDYWNAAMREMRFTGYMHNYMRMYWGKKILEWTNTPGYGYRVALELNNRYFLDGRDPNSFAGVGWIFGLHDRPWSERAVYGQVRSMTADGLRRKCDPDAYVARVDELVRAATA